MRIAAAWLQEGGDSPEQEFDTEIIFYLPGNEEGAYAVGFPRFKFVRPVHRLIVPEPTAPSNLDMKPGLLRLANRIRRAGEAEWARQQEYVILAAEKVQEATTPQPAPRAMPPAPHADTSA
jgi:hypothetical protein